MASPCADALTWADTGLEDLQLSGCLPVQILLRGRQSRSSILRGGGVQADGVQKETEEAGRPLTPCRAHTSC